MTKEIQKRDKGIKDLLTGDAFKAQVQNALPQHLKAERFIRIALTALTRTPKLTQCSQESFFQSLLTLSQLGLEPDGRLAHLIPYGDACTVIVDYKGLCDLAMRSGKVSNIHADIVCENDVFEYDRGEVKTHKIDFKKPRGAMYAVYAICRFKDGTEASAVMTKDEVEAIRTRSKAGKSGPWVTDWNEMAKKTAFRRLAKWLPLSPEYRDALEQDHDQFEPINITPEHTDIEMPKRLSEQVDEVVEPEDNKEPDDEA
jgi:recombination protein RecT